MCLAAGMVGVRFGGWREGGTYRFWIEWRRGNGKGRAYVCVSGLGLVCKVSALVAWEVVAMVWAPLLVL